MKIRILGAGFYGCHLGLVLKKEHDVEIHEIKSDIFGGASGKIPARIHQGYHYPRSKKTREACQQHEPDFLKAYGQFVKSVPTNIYAIAKDRSLVDFDQFTSSLVDEVKFKIIEDPRDYGLQNVEGAVLTEEKHIIVNRVREYFRRELADCLKLNTEPGEVDSLDYDLTIDATFCANESAGVDRYEPCVVGLLAAPVHTAVTIMDGPFSSLYPWDEHAGLCSLSSARFTPMSKECKTWQSANNILSNTSRRVLIGRVYEMLEDLSNYYPVAQHSKIVDVLSSLRAMPLSGADSRLVDVIRVGDRACRIRAGKIDGVLLAEKLIKEFL